MPYLKSRDIAAIALCAGLWGVLNSIFSPIFFQMFGLPILCDMMGFSVLALTAWWTRKLGSVTAVGLIATVINFIFNPGAVHFLGFTVASVVFDVAEWLVRYDKAFNKTVYITVSIVSVSTLSAAVAGFIIGTFFMGAPALARWGGVYGWAALHATGGVIGGIIGVVIITALVSRGIQAKAKNLVEQKIPDDVVK